MRKKLLTLLFFILATALNAQEKLNIKFGKIEAADFSVSSSAIDSSTNAVVLSDIGNSKFEGNNSGWFSLIYKRHKRIKILNKKGVDAATVEIPLYKNRKGDQEILEDIRATTYNLENGKVVSTKLESSNIFVEQTNKNIVTKKFTFPGVKEESIIEYSYTIKSDFLFNLQPWSFQGEYPCLWSEYEVNIPEFFNYVYLKQGYLKFDIQDKSSTSGSFIVSQSRGTSATERFNIPGQINVNRWVIKNAPAMKEEPFTSTLKNHISKIDFQLAEYRFPDMPTEPIMGNWAKVGEELMKSENFGIPINRNNGWLDAELPIIIKGAANKIEVAQKLYTYVRDNFTSTSFGTRLSEGSSLKDIFKTKNGSVADINLLLTAMMRHEKIKAYPVMLSTKANGVTHEVYPLMDRYNYLICLISVDSSEYCLDASKPRLGFGKLPAYCYNGDARVIAENPNVVSLIADNLSEIKLTNVIIINNEKGEIEGASFSRLGYYESLNLRDKLVKTSSADYFKGIAKEFPAEIKTSNFSIDSLNLYEEPVAIKHDFKVEINGEDVIYFNPMLNEAMKENPFKSLKRLYPVEMPYVINETYVLSMEVPKGYVVDELPKSARVNLNENEGMFEYIITNRDGIVQLRSRLILKKANYNNEDYEVLRDFFGHVVKKQNEQVVFKKIKS